jgi:DNA-binding NarL/FixJ family response regulator
VNRNEWADLLARDPELAALTDRQREVVYLLATSTRVTQAAAELGVARGVVMAHIVEIRRVLDFPPRSRNGRPPQR